MLEKEAPTSQKEAAGMFTATRRIRRSPRCQVIVVAGALLCHQPQSEALKLHP